jgi:hypothetical protein
VAVAVAVSVAVAVAVAPDVSVIAETAVMEAQVMATEVAGWQTAVGLPAECQHYLLVMKIPVVAWSLHPINITRTAQI